MEDYESAEAQGPASGFQIHSLLQALQQRKNKQKAAAEQSIERKKEAEENWKRGLLASPKKKLAERWEQVSPSVKQTLERYSPRRIKGWFSEDQARDEDESTMDACSSIPTSTPNPNQMISDRQSRYKQIADFCLKDTDHEESLAASQLQLYLETVPTTSSPHTSVPSSQVLNSSTVHISYEASVRTSLDKDKHDSLSEISSERNCDKNITKISREAAKIEAERIVAEIFSKAEKTLEGCNETMSENLTEIMSSDMEEPINPIETEIQKCQNKILETDFPVAESIGKRAKEKRPSRVKFHDPQLDAVDHASPVGLSIEIDVNEIDELPSCKDGNKGEEKTENWPVVPPQIVLPGEGPPRRPTTLHPPPPDPDGGHKRKSPVTVQEWVDHLPVKPPAPPPEIRTEEPIESSPLLRCQATSRLSREPSVQSSSSLDSLLDSRKPDPVEVLLNLGFGGVPGIDLDNCRIPKRFLIPSKCKGGDWEEFLRRELLQAQNFECSTLGFRGLSGQNHQRPSAIVANIMEKLRERTCPRPVPRPITRFSSVAKRVLSETSVLSKLSTQNSSASVLTPDNRKFLESQGKISPEVPRRRIIFGEKSFAISRDGELMEEVTSPVKSSPPTAAPSAGSWSGGSGVSMDAGSDSEDVRCDLVMAPSPADLLRMRRSSLQRQRRIVSDDGDDGDGPAEPRRFDAVDEGGEDLRDALAAEIETLSRRIQSAAPEDLVAILEPIKELRGRLTDV